MSILLIAFTFCFSTISAKAQNLIKEGATPEKVTEGFQFTEGPYWHPDGYLLFSDIPANTIYKWTPGSMQSEVYIRPSGHSNGITADSKGNLVLAQHNGMVSVVQADFKITPVAEMYQGKRLNSPNDVAVRSDGSIFFTDPPFGVSEEDQELTFSGVYQITTNGELNLIYDKLSRPNGLVFAPGEETLYVNDSSSGRILAFEVTGDSDISSPVEFASVGSADNTGAADGMTVDKDGNIYTTGPGGLIIFNSEGELIEKVEVPERITNVTWGGDNNDILFLTAPSSVYSLEMNTSGS